MVIFYAEELDIELWYYHFMTNLIRGLILLLVAYIIATYSPGFGEIGVYITLYFLIEYFFFLKRKPQAVLDDSINKYYLGKKILATIILPSTLLLFFYLISEVVPTRSNIKPGIIMIFVIIVLSTILYIDIKRREGLLNKSVYRGLIYGSVISAAIFVFILFSL
jgi:hypothetical protein